MTEEDREYFRKLLKRFNRKMVQKYHDRERPRYMAFDQWFED